MIFAAIQTAEPDPLAGLRANLGPVDVPWPAWVWWCIGVGSVVLIALLVWLGYWLAHRKPKTIPPTARQIALRQLEELRARAPHTEPYEFSVANCMITNFHMPKTSLLIMVCAFGGYDLIMEAYRIAMKEKYKFATYGDAMLLM